MNPNVSHLQNLGSEKTTYTYERPNSGILETFDHPAPEMAREFTVEIEFPEFTSLCPKTGQPDFATIQIEYCPRLRCVESKSLKLYFFAWRNEGSFMETITTRIMKDLVEVLDPIWITVTGKFAPRGATKLWPTATYRAPDYFEEASNAVSAG